MVQKLDHNQKIEGLEGVTICDFWTWAYSDILNNRNRSIFAEFIVGAALEVIGDSRIEWDAFDLRYKDFKIEVKSAAYVQSWEQKKHSTIRFDIAKKRGWDALTNEYKANPIRCSDCYVFCVYTEKNYDNADPTNLKAWDFYVIPTDELNIRFDNQKGIALSRIQEFCDPVKYEGLKKKIDEVLALKIQISL
ncbi:MAG: hypothetical protein QCH31_05255 [Methanolobus sp.]|nr:hypothetical protein [Methanolobus sp.]